MAFQYAKIYPNAGTYPNGIPQVNITNYAPECRGRTLHCFRPPPTFKSRILLHGLKEITPSRRALSVIS